mmetsp:Transcript_8372/g.19628  ORF Transcript_8372/g.19628 Transcript_8372/m.19628 type:complete len:204 (-) Transcript_8372:344-955(-)
MPALQGEEEGRLLPTCAKLFLDLILVVAAEADPVTHRGPLPVATDHFRMLPERHAEVLECSAPEVAHEPLGPLRPGKLGVGDLLLFGQGLQDIAVQIIGGPVADEVTESVQHVVQLAHTKSTVGTFLTVSGWLLGQLLFEGSQTPSEQRGLRAPPRNCCGCCEYEGRDCCPQTALCRHVRSGDQDSKGHDHDRKQWQTECHRH